VWGQSGEYEYQVDYFVGGSVPCIGVPATPVNGTHVLQRACDTVYDGSNTTVFAETSVGDSLFTVQMNGTSESFCMDTANGATTASTQIVMGHCTGSSTQKWMWDQVGSNYLLLNAGAQLCLTGYAIADGSGHYNDLIEPCSGSATNQRIQSYAFDGSSLS
jgi:hypothetical protein